MFFTEVKCVLLYLYITYIMEAMVNKHPVKIQQERGRNQEKQKTNLTS